MVWQAGAQGGGSADRDGWDAVSAVVRDNRIFEVKSTYILQPGPAALTDGVRRVHAVLCGVVGLETPPVWTDDR